MTGKIVFAFSFAIGAVGFAYAIASLRQGWVWRFILGLVVFVGGLYVIGKTGQ